MKKTVREYRDIVDYAAFKRIRTHIAQSKFEDLHGLAKNTCFYFESKKRILGLGTLLPVLEAYECTLYVNGVKLTDAMQLIDMLEEEKEKRGLSEHGLAVAMGLKGINLGFYRQGYTPRTTKLLQMCKGLGWEVQIDG